MNRKDLPLIIGLVALLLAWPFIDRHLVRPLFGNPPPAPPPKEQGVPAGEGKTPALEAPGAPSPAGTGAVEQVSTEGEQPPAVTPVGTAAGEGEQTPAAEEVEPPSTTPARTVVLKNDRMELTLSSYGASVQEARMLDYRSAIAADSPPVTLDFRSAPALACEDIPGFGTAYDFEVTVSEDGREARFTRRAASGFSLTRVVRLSDSYEVDVRDEWSDASGASTTLPATGLHLGPMENLPGETSMRGIAYLGVDTLGTGAAKVTYWGRKIRGLFKTEQSATQAPRPPANLRQELPLGGNAVDWVAVKNKYFVQILRPEESARGVALEARRTVAPEEETDPSAKVRVTVEQVAATLLTAPAPIAAGRPLAKEWHYYVGPKKFTELNQIAFHQVNVMEFGMWAPIGKVLLHVLNGIHRVLPNYGVAIMLLTILIRIIFWPITHKSTQSMKRMQEIQPLVKEIRDRYKDNPQRQQKEIMALYKEHKVNPVGGCLPMLIQIPVFIALFVVLRSAIELRFAPFLWVHDLSEPENLLAGLLPIPLNILPLIMTGTQFLQQRLTPQAADSSQQKMMAFMPFIMLVFFYNFASGLVLYWTTNQTLMIVQQLWQRRRHK